MWKSAGLVSVLVWAAVLAGCAADEKGKPAREGAVSERPSRDTAGTELKPAAAGTDAVAAGRKIYDENCGSCHRAGSYDKDGKIDVTRRVDEISQGFVARHHGESLTSEDVAHLKAFLNSVGVNQ